MRVGLALSRSQRLFSSLPAVGENTVVTCKMAITIHGSKTVYPTILNFNAYLRGGT